MTYILGAMDKMTPPKRAADLIAATEGATVVTLPGVGHMMMRRLPMPLVGRWSMPSSRSGSELSPVPSGPTG